MIKSSIENIAQSIGFDIGNSDDQTQANLINGFCEALHNSMSNHDREKQICYIVDKLSKKSELILTIFYEFIKLKNGKL